MSSMAPLIALGTSLLAVVGAVEIHLPVAPADLGQLQTPEAVAAQLRLAKMLEGDEADSLQGPSELARIQVQNDPASSVTELNRITLEGNVLRESTPSAENWFVIFCVEWYEPCQQQLQEFEIVSAAVQAEANRDSFLKAPVRFAKTSCSKDKALCNELGVDNYPTITHYFQGKRQKRWRSSKTPLATWVAKQLAWAAGRQQTVDAFADLRLALRELVPSKLTVRWAMNVLAMSLIMFSTVAVVLRELLPARAKKPQTQAPAPTAAPEPPVQLPAPIAVLPDAWARDRAILDL